MADEVKSIEQEWRAMDPKPRYSGGQQVRVFLYGQWRDARTNNIVPRPWSPNAAFTVWSVTLVENNTLTNIAEPFMRPRD